MPPRRSNSRGTLRTGRPQSVLCVPFNRHGAATGAIYMENKRRLRRVHIETEIEVIKLLAAQTAISVETQELYGQTRLIEAQRRFVPSEFLESLARRDIAHVGVGECVAQHMTVMFADLRGFTPIAEQLDPRNVIELLNQYSQHGAADRGGGQADQFLRRRRDRRCRGQGRLRRPRRRGRCGGRSTRSICATPSSISPP